LVAVVCKIQFIVRHLSTLVVIKTDGTLTTKTLGPPSIKFNVGLWHAAVGEEEPSTEDWLGEDVKDSIGNDLSVNIDVTGAISDTPNNWVNGPDDKSETTNGGEEISNLSALAKGSTATLESENPDDDKVGDACNGVPSPLLRGTLATEGGKETSQDHDNVGDEGNENVTSRDAGKKGEIEKKKRSGQTPVDISCPVNLTVNVLGGVWNVLVGLSDGGVVVRYTVSGGHGEVGERCKDDDQGRDDVIQALADWYAP